MFSRKLNIKRLPAGIKHLTFSLIFLMMMPSFASGNSKIKQPNVSGQFYDANPQRLSSQIDQFFSAASVTPSQKRVEVLIAPHAGYVYSGAVAAYGFKAASARSYKTIVILAPSHHVGFDGVSIWEEGGFKTPLGTVDVDEAFSKRLIAAHEKFIFEPRAFEREHALEVEIPFLQKTFTDFKIVPVVMGQPDFELLDTFARALKQIIAQREDVLIVVSTDFSHYHDDATARTMDHSALKVIEKMDVEQLWSKGRAQSLELCGLVPVTAALLYAQQKGLDDIEVLRYANSGDVSGDKDRVVGYASIVIYGNSHHPLSTTGEIDADGVSSLTFAQKKRLVDIARTTIEEKVKNNRKLNVTETDSRLLEVEGAFVTIHKAEHLRGCIGNIIGRQPLYLTVRDMAIAAASNDPRFSPVTSDELADIDIEVSVLSQPRAIKSVDEIKLGTHGVIISQGPWHQGVFLPQVATETGWTKEEFLSQLCSQKADLPRDAWKDPKTKIEIFSADVFSEKDL